VQAHDSLRANGMPTERAGRGEGGG
jgi:hypothetical protein